MTDTTSFVYNDGTHFGGFNPNYAQTQNTFAAGMPTTGAGADAYGRHFQQQPGAANMEMGMGGGWNNFAPAAMAAAGGYMGMGMGAGMMSGLATSQFNGYNTQAAQMPFAHGGMGFTHAGVVSAESIERTMVLPTRQKRILAIVDASTHRPIAPDSMSSRASDADTTTAPSPIESPTNDDNGCAAPATAPKTAPAVADIAAGLAKVALSSSKATTAQTKATPKKLPTASWGDMAEDDGDMDASCFSPTSAAIMAAHTLTSASTAIRQLSQRGMGPTLIDVLPAMEFACNGEPLAMLVWELGTTPGAMLQHIAPLVARLCDGATAGSAGTDGPSVFRRCLLKKCQDAFTVSLDTAEDSPRAYLNARFIGALFAQHVVAGKTIVFALTEAVRRAAEGAGKREGGVCGTMACHALCLAGPELSTSEAGRGWLDNWVTTLSKAMSEHPMVKTLAEVQANGWKAPPPPPAKPAWKRPDEAAAPVTAATTTTTTTEATEVCAVEQQRPLISLNQQQQQHRPAPRQPFKGKVAPPNNGNGKGGNKFAPRAPPNAAQQQQQQQRGDAPGGDWERVPTKGGRKDVAAAPKAHARPQRHNAAARPNNAPNNAAAPAH